MAAMTTSARHPDAPEWYRNALDVPRTDETVLVVAEEPRAGLRGGDPRHGPFVAVDPPCAHGVPDDEEAAARSRVEVAARAHVDRVAAGLGAIYLVAAARFAYEATIKSARFVLFASLVHLPFVVTAALLDPHVHRVLGTG